MTTPKAETTTKKRQNSDISSTIDDEKDAPMTEPTSSSSTASPSTTTEQQSHLVLKSLNDEYQSVVRVSHRVDHMEQMEQFQSIVLDKLLVKLFFKFQTNYRALVVVKRSVDDHDSSTTTSMFTAILNLHQKIHDQLIQLFSQILKRIQQNHSNTNHIPTAKSSSTGIHRLVIPCLPLLRQLFFPHDTDASNTNTTTGSTTTPTSNILNMDSYTINFAFTFLQLGLLQQQQQQQPQRRIPSGNNNNTIQTASTITATSNDNDSINDDLQLLKLLLILHRDAMVLAQQQSTSSSPPTYDIKIAHFIRMTILVLHSRKMNTVSSNNASVEKVNKDKNDIQHVRTLLLEQPSIASCFYDLCLDLLLYVPTATVSGTNATTGTLPPPGLSHHGWQRFIGITTNQHHHNNATTPMHWSNERPILVQNKFAIYSMIAPIAALQQQQLFHLFMNTTMDSSASVSSDSNHNRIMVQRNMARMVVLMVVASGIHYTEIADRATLDLKQYLDRSNTIATTGTSRGSSTNTSGNKYILLGDPMMVAIELISLCLGQIHSDRIILEQQPKVLDNSDDTMSSLGYSESPPDDSSVAPTTVSSSFLIQRKRRPLDEIIQCPKILTFISNHILTDHIRLFQEQTNPMTISIFSHMTTQLLHRILCSNNNSTQILGLSTLRAKPYIAAAEFLSVFSIRLSVYCDDKNYPSTIINAGENDDTITLLCRCLSIACTVLLAITTSSSISSNSSTNDGSLTVRDACYGVIATLSRCAKFVLHHHGYLFGCGSASIHSSGRNGGIEIMNIDTAALLFGCTTHEDERLRPRAVAALDALLAAYQRWLSTLTQLDDTLAKDINGVNQEERMTPDKQNNASTNPWAVTTSTDFDDEGPTVDYTGLSNLIRNLLWSVVRRQQSTTACRVAAARWSCDLWKEIDLLNACHMLCFLSGDSDSTVASIARDGIGLPKQFSDNDDDISAVKSSVSVATNKFPDFGAFTTLMFPGINTTSQHRYWDFAYAGKAATLRCALYCLLNDFYSGDNDAGLARYVSAMTITLKEVVKVSNQLVDDSSIQRKFSVDLLDECAACLLTTLSSSQFARRQMIRTNDTEQDGFGVFDIPHLCLTTNSSRSRRYLAGAYGLLLEDSNLWSKNWTSWIGETVLHSTLTSCETNIQEIEKRNPMLSRLHGSAFLGAYIIRALQCRNDGSSENPGSAECWSSAANVLESLGRGILHDEDIVSNACSDSLSIALSYEKHDFYRLNGSLHKCLVGVVSNLAKALKKYGHSDAVNPARTLKLAKACGFCLAATASDGVDSESTTGMDNARFECIDALFDLLGSMASRKTEEICIVVGEALADFSDVHNAYGDEMINPNISVWPVEFDEDFAKKLPSQEQVLFILLRKVFLAASPHKRIACAPALLAVTSRGAYRLNMDTTAFRRPLVRSLISHLDEIQQAFLTLMSDPKGKQFSRESSCIGLAACRGLVGYVDDREPKLNVEQSVINLNNRLLRAFGQTTNFGGSAMMETEAQAAARRAAEGRDQNVDETLESAQIGEVGGASGIGEAALGAYREMASASVALGRHDIMYGLLFLSLSHPFWLTSEAKYRYSATCLLGETLSVGADTNSAEFRMALRPFLGKLIPRILRGCHDPNKQTKEQMLSLWRGLTGGGADGRQAISQHLTTTVDALLGECSSKLWRARVGACGALSEVIVGREWSDLGGGGAVLNDDDLLEGSVVSAGVRLLRIWNATARALDDVQGAVRDSGETLARAARALTIRLCSPTKTEENGMTDRVYQTGSNAEIDAAAAAGTSIWWLMRKGLNHTCPEVTGASMSTLVEIIGVVRPAIIEPSLSTLLTSLLLAVSALEPSALNYMQQRTSDQEGLERARLQLAQTGPLAVALTKCLEVVPRSKLETQQSIAPALDTALRQSAGFATRAATADAVSTLCSSCSAVFRFTGSSVSNPSVRLLRAFYFASERERGTAAKDKMIHALGNLAAICPTASVRSLAVRACDRYRYSTGNNFDPSSRRAAAAALRTIAVRASNVFNDGGRGDIWCKRVLPVAFIGRKDSDAKIALMWQEVWDDGGSVANTSDTSSPMRNFGTRLEEKLLQHLVKECVSALQDVSWSSRVAGASALQDLCSIGVLSPVAQIAQSLPEQHSEFSLLRAQNRANASQLAMTQCIEVLVKPRLWDGKSELLKTVALLSSKWIVATVSDNGDVLDENTLDEFVSVRPWWPIIISTGNYQSDLCINDGWFTRSDIAESPVEPKSNATDTIETDEIRVIEDRSSINFHDCDELLGGGDEVEEFVSNTINNQEKLDLDPIVTFKGLGRFLIEQAIPPPGSQRSTIDLDISLIYRTTAFSCFKDLMNSVPTSYVSTRSELYRILSLSLLSMISPLASDNNIEQLRPPVLIAGSINSIEALLWEGIGISNTNDCDISKLIATMREVGGEMQPAWTVRAAAAQCISQIIRLCDDETIQQYKVVSNVVAAAQQALTDRRFWKVRVAGLNTLSHLIDRAGTNTSHNRQEMMKNLESLLPHKEAILKLIRSSLNDTNSNVTVLATSILKRMSWWP